MRAKRAEDLLLAMEANLASQNVIFFFCEKLFAFWLFAAVEANTSIRRQHWNRGLGGLLADVTQTKGQKMNTDAEPVLESTERK